MVGLGFVRIYVVLTIFQSYRDLQAGDTLKFKLRWRGSNPGPLALQVKSDHSTIVAPYKEFHRSLLKNKYPNKNSNPINLKTQVVTFISYGTVFFENIEIKMFHAKIDDFHLLLKWNDLQCLCKWMNNSDLIIIAITCFLHFSLFSMSPPDQNQCCALWRLVWMFPRSRHIPI